MPAQSLQPDYVPVADEIMAAEDDERQTWLEIRRRTYRYFLNELGNAYIANTIPDLIGRWIAESLR